MLTAFDGLDWREAKRKFWQLIKPIVAGLRCENLPNFSLQITEYDWNVEVSFSALSSILGIFVRLFFHPISSLLFVSFQFVVTYVLLPNCW